MKINDTLDKIKGIYGINKGDLDFLNLSSDHDYLEVLINSKPVSFQSITNYLNTMGLSSVVLRMPQLIDKQLSKLYNSFSHAFNKYNYPSLYRGVFPVKVNHNFSVLNAISTYGANYGHGFEVGTKPELLIALNMKNVPSLIICNGTKDDDYINAALTLSKKGYNILISIESLRELKDLIRISNQRQIKPQIGLRIKMQQRVEGHWGHSSGLYSKFGLSASELLEIINELNVHDFLSCVRLLHGHLGSQINKASYFKRAVTELVGYYQNIYDLGATGLRYINLGGGLAIDYEGNNQPEGSGTSYSFEDYADTIVSTIIDCLKDKPEIIPPDIITESGRAISATSSMLLVEVLENRPLLPEVNQFNIYSSREIETLEKNALLSIKNLKSLKQIENFLLTFTNSISKLQDKKNFWTEFRYQKDVELITAIVNKHLLSKVKQLMVKNDRFFDADIKEQFPKVFSLLTTYTDDLVGNFSVFRGACDIVLAQQYFPIIPTVGLHSTPKTLVRLIDITCDSDGEVVKFISKLHSDKTSNPSNYFTKEGQLLAHPSKILHLNGIPLPEKNTKVGSYIVLALTGAYQDTVQFDQNLLGALPEVELVIDTNGSPHFKILSYAESNSNLINDMRHNITTINSLDHLLFSNPYVNNKSPSSIQSIEFIESSKSNRSDEDLSESDQINMN